MRKTILTTVLVLINTSSALALSGNYRETRKSTGLRNNSNFHTVNIFGSDDRKKLDRIDESGQSTPFDAIGQLKHNKGQFVSTAFLISRCHILATYHGTFNDFDDPRKSENLTFFVGDNSKAGPSASPFRSRTKATPVAWGDYTQSRNPDPAERARLRGHENEDWAVLRLEDCLGDEYGWLEMEKKILPDVRMPYQNKLILPGFPKDRSNRTLWADQTCSAKNHAPGLVWLLDCDIRQGNSGGPLIYLDANGKPKVIAMVAREYEPSEAPVKDWDINKSNGAASMFKIYDKIVSAVEADSGQLALAR